MAAEKMSEVRHSILTRCSTRSFTAEPVPDELLMQLIEAGLAGPGRITITPGTCTR